MPVFYWKWAKKADFIPFMTRNLGIFRLYVYQAYFAEKVRQFRIPQVACSLRKDGTVQVSTREFA